MMGLCIRVDCPEGGVGTFEVDNHPAMAGFACALTSKSFCWVIFEDSKGMSAEDYIHFVEGPIADMARAEFGDGGNVINLDGFAKGYLDLAVPGQGFP